VSRKNAYLQRAKRRREHLTPDEVEKLLAASKTASRNRVRDYPMLLMAFRHGLRVSELVGMKLKDIDLNAKEFHVVRLKGCDNANHPFYNGESHAIAKWLVKRKAMKVPQNVDTLFVSERRRPMSRVTFWLMVKLTAEATGLGHLEIHPHILADTRWSTRERTFGSSRGISGTARSVRQSDTQNLIVVASRNSLASPSPAQKTSLARKSSLANKYRLTN
jgi:site-specific recombinase XerD